MQKAQFMALSVVVSLALVACSNGQVDQTAAEDNTALSKEPPQVSFKPEPGYDGTIAKPGAPFTVSYKVIGTPIVGSPVTLDLRVTSTLGPEPVTIRYRISDASALMFPEAQPSEVELAPAANDDFIGQRVTIVPQREGRHYLNVAASVETDNGSMSSIMAIPIQVGGGGRELIEHGEAQLDENGEPIRVLTPE
ncbi:MAG: hypothetical protein GY949_08190 [Gammaproteobacteria bacterium]|nr:hypothetical protein [Gammaproteobacteria bacterium]